MDTESQAYNEFVIRNPFHSFLIISALVISRNFLNAFGASSLILQEHISSVSIRLSFDLTSIGTFHPKSITTFVQVLILPLFS